MWQDTFEGHEVAEWLVQERIISIVLLYTLTINRNKLKYKEPLVIPLWMRNSYTLMQVGKLVHELCLRFQSQKQVLGFKLLDEFHTS